MTLLLHPRTTLAAMIAGLSSIASMATATIVGLTPLASMPQLLGLRPWLARVDFTCGALAAGCIILTALGRSIAPWVDRKDTGRP